MNLGVLYPRSTAYPEIAIDFMDGLKTFFRKVEMDNQVHVHSDSVGFGGSEKEVYQITEKLLMTHDIDVLVIFIDLKVLPILEPLLTAHGKLTLVVNPGANFPQNWIPQPNIIFISLHHAFLCWLSGSLAAKHTTQAAVAGTLYDCGYLHAAAMVKNYTKSGGTISYNYINKQSYDQNFQLDELTSFLTADKKTNTLLCVFDAAPASFFYDRVNSFEGADGLQLFVSPMMLEQKALRGLNEGFLFSIEGYMPWLASLDNPANHLFTGYYRQQTKKSPCFFSLLGWESGLILQQVFLHTEDYSDSESIVNKLLAAKIAGPRGELTIDRDTHYLLAPVIKCLLKNGNPVMETAVIENINEDWRSFASETVEGITSGWTNTYLCY